MSPSGTRIDGVADKSSVLGDGGHFDFSLNRISDEALVVSGVMQMFLVLR